MIEVKGGKFIFNGVKKERVIGRSSFKLSNVLTYHWTGQGGGKYGFGLASRWIEHNQNIFGQDVVLRVFLETAGWNECTDCMFGSEPQDKGFWNRQLLRDGKRETSMHPVGKKVLEWLFRTSQETGVAFELIIDATLKHDDIPKGEIDHVIRQTGMEMGRLSGIYPKSLVIPNLRNEWNAHNQSGHTLRDVNMWAVRWDRDDYWRDAAKIIDPGGSNTFTYDVGPEDGKYRAGMIHPDRGDGWHQFPSPGQIARLKRDARGMPVGFTESMYYVEKEDRDRAEKWYRNPGGWTANWGMYQSFLEHAIPIVDYFIVHDEKGAQSDPDWPRKETRVESWARDYFQTGPSLPPPPPPPPPEEEEMIIVYGQNFVLVKIPEPIVVDVEQDGDESFQNTYLLKLKKEVDVVAVDSFFGHDRGDAYEMAVEVFSDTDPAKAENARDFLWRRINEATAPDEAGSMMEHLAENVELRALKVQITCRVTGANELVNSDHPSYKKWRGVFDFNMMLITR